MGKFPFPEIFQILPNADVAFGIGSNNVDVVPESVDLDYRLLNNSFSVIFHGSSHLLIADVACESRLLIAQFHRSPYFVYLSVITLLVGEKHVLLPEIGSTRDTVSVFVRVHACAYVVKSCRELPRFNSQCGIEFVFYRTLWLLPLNNRWICLLRLHHL